MYILKIQSGLTKFLTTDSHLKMLKNVFISCQKSFWFYTNLNICTVHVQKRLGKKAKVHFKNS